MRFEILGEPVAWARARTGGGHHFTPSKQADHMDLIRMAWHRDPERAPFPKAAALRLEVTTWHSRPRAHYGTGKNADKLKPNAPAFKISRPDFDNYVKIVADALNQVAYHDDAQIVSAVVEKRYVTAEQPMAATSVTLRVA